MSLRYSQNNAIHVAKMWALKCLGYHLIVGPKNASALGLYLALVMLAKGFLKLVNSSIKCTNIQKGVENNHSMCNSYLFTKGVLVP